MPQLYSLDLHDNRLTGALPEWGTDGGMARRAAWHWRLHSHSMHCPRSWTASAQLC